MHLWSYRSYSETILRISCRNGWGILRNISDRACCWYRTLHLPKLTQAGLNSESSGSSPQCFKEISEEYYYKHVKLPWHHREKEDCGCSWGKPQSRDPRSKFSDTKPHHLLLRLQEFFFSLPSPTEAQSSAYIYEDPTLLKQDCTHNSPPWEEVRENKSRDRWQPSHLLH